MTLNFVCTSSFRSLVAFRGEDITEDEIKKLEPIVGDEGFTVENMKSKSAAAANLCSWVISIYTYNRIYVKVHTRSIVGAQTTTLSNVPFQQSSS